VRLVVTARRVGGAAFAVVGALYVWRGTLALMRLRPVVEHWTQSSGDPDFRYDTNTFIAYVGAGALSVAALGAATVWNGVAAARGRHSRWLALAIAALPIHWFWWMYRIIGTGALGRAAHDAARRDTAVQFGIVCAAYWVMWVLTRSRD
jgi:hypothetical protein